MQVLSQTEENYLKSILKLEQQENNAVTTNSISAEINTTAASVTDMLKKLNAKNLINYIKYKGVSLTDEGRRTADLLVRKHRLWEVFLADKLKMRWDEVHDIAEQLEHIHSPLLIQRLDEFLGYPKFDPHGDPIPDQFGNYTMRPDILLEQLKPGQKGVIVGVKDHSPDFLQYLGNHSLILGCVLEVREIAPYDKSVVVVLGAHQEVTISSQVASNLVVNKIN